jgi:hypothetical protein
MAIPSVHAGDEVAALSTQEMVLIFERPNHSHFSADLGYLGALGDRLFLGDLYASTIGATRS